MKKFLMRFWKDTEGQDLIEYALLVATIALGMIVTMKNIATAISSLYESISTGLATIGQ